MTPPAPPPFGPEDLVQLLDRLGIPKRHAARALDIEDRTLRYWASGQVPVPRMAILALRYLTEHPEDL